MTRAGPTASHVLDRVLVLEMVRVTEAAAIAAASVTRTISSTSTRSRTCEAVGPARVMNEKLRS